MAKNSNFLLKLTLKKQMDAYIKEAQEKGQDTNDPELKAILKILDKKDFDLIEFIDKMSVYVDKHKDEYGDSQVFQKAVPIVQKMMK